MNVLVVAAHPDDEILGCGGTMTRLTREGNELVVLILGEGVTSRSDTPGQADPAELKNLREAAREANRICGASRVIFGGLPDNRLDTFPLLEVVKAIESVIAEYRPNVVFTHHGSDLNIDHAVIHRATLTATRPLPDSSVRTVYTYEVNSSTEWSFGQFAGLFSPSVYFDISDTLAAKVEAMKAYSGEIRRFPHPRSVEALEALARVRGSQAGLQSAEAFELVRQVVGGGGEA